METLWGDETPAPSMQPKPAAKKQTPATISKYDCVYYGHTWQVVGMLGEKQCLACGQKIYCPRCTTHSPINAEPSYCPLHTSKHQEQ